MAPPSTVSLASTHVPCKRPRFASILEPKSSLLHLILHAPSIFFVKATPHRGYATSTHSTIATTYATDLQGCLRWGSTSSSLPPPHPTYSHPNLSDKEKNVYPPTFLVRREFSVSESIHYSSLFHPTLSRIPPKAKVVCLQGVSSYPRRKGTTLPLRLLLEMGQRAPVPPTPRPPTPPTPPARPNWDARGGEEGRGERSRSNPSQFRKKRSTPLLPWFFSFVPPQLLAWFSRADAVLRPVNYLDSAI